MKLLKICAALFLTQPWCNKFCYDEEWKCGKFDIEGKDGLIGWYDLGCLCFENLSDCNLTISTTIKVIYGERNRGEA